MSEVNGPQGHAAFHVKHHQHGTGNGGERLRLLREAGRHFSEKDSRRFAKNNSSIVAAETAENIAFVNDGDGGFRRAKSVSEINQYATAREEKVRRKIQETQTTLSTFVSFLPRTLCEEQKNYYKQTKEDGTTVFRSRWIPRDKDEAMRYFADVVEFLGEKVSPGGVDSVSGWVVNFDESTPHIHLFADPFAPDPKGQEGDLRTEFSRAYTSHRDVRKPNGKMYGKGELLQKRAAEFRGFMIDKGWPVEAERSDKPNYGPKEDYVEAMEALDSAELLNADTKLREAMVRKASRKLGLRDQSLAFRQNRLDKRENELDEREEKLDIRERSLTTRERDVSKSFDQLSAKHQKADQLLSSVEDFDNLQRNEWAAAIADLDNTYDKIQQYEAELENGTRVLSARDAAALRRLRAEFSRGLTRPTAPPAPSSSTSPGLAALRAADEALGTVAQDEDTYGFDT